EAGMAPKGKFARYMNYFRENPFYDRTALEGEICKLSRRYPARVFAAAGRLLAAVCEDSDLEKMTVLCESVSKRGLAAAKRVLTAIRRLSPNSTKRSFEYVKELLDGVLGEEG
ncbi:MAG: hypothetical protein WC690_04100, partial [bacterium]